MRTKTKLVLSQSLLMMCSVMGVEQASAAIWSDTSLSYKYGTTFHEPFNDKDISKNIFALTHVSGYSMGTNFFNVDMLVSDSKDPGAGVSGKPGAQEVYVVYRNTLDLSKATGKSMKFGPIKTIGLTGGFDYNTKNDFYASKKRMLVVGPTVSFDVKGFLDIGVLALIESNAPSFINKRYSYDTHPALSVTWGLPIADLPLSFDGYALWIASKGKNESGGGTSPEFHLDAKVMYDLSKHIGVSPKTVKVGIEYEYWHNKFGNSDKPISEGGVGEGGTASTPMIRAEYHF